MKNRVQKILLTGVLCVMSVAAACGEANEPQAVEEQQENAKRTAPETDAGNCDFTPEAEGEPADSEAGDTAGATGNEAGDNTDPAQENVPAVENVPAAWSDTPPDLEGDIREMQDGQITVVKAVIEEGANGGEVMVGPGDGADDSEFDKVSVTYDENTLFAVQTIYDGGARSEMSEATAADLAENQLVKVWGSSSGDALDAVQICIVKVE